MKARLIIAFVSVGFVVACEAQNITPEMNQPEYGACQSEEIAPFIGQNRSTVHGVRFTGPVRVINQGEAVTMDYSPGRFNFVVGANQIIIEAYCG